MHRRAFQWFASGILSAALSIGCNERRATISTAELRAAAASGLCLAQLSGNAIKLISLQGSRGTYNIPIATSGGSALTWGRVALDGRQVVARRASLADGEDSLVSISLDGKVLWEVKSHVVGIPAISPTGDKIAFLSNNGLTVFDVAARRQTTISASGTTPAWSPDGNRVAYTEGDGIVRVAEFNSVSANSVTSGSDPSWTPTGDSLAVRRRAGDIDIVDLAGEVRQRHFIVGADTSVPRWAPDGQWFEYTRLATSRWWSFNDAVSEARQVVVRDVKNEREAVVGWFYKGEVGDYNWVKNDSLCP